MKKIITIVVIIFLIASMMIACGKANDEEVDTENDNTTERMSDEEIINNLCDGEYITNVRQESIHIDGIENEYKFVYIADLHIIVPSDRVTETDKETIDWRYSSWAKNANGHKSEEIYTHLIDNINATDVDAVLMGGDMLDFLSEANWNHLKSGLDKLEMPYLYATADHDLRTYYADYSVDEGNQLRNDMSQGLIDVLEYDEFIILSVNESTAQLTEDAIVEIEKVVEIGKPIIVMLHVPLDSTVDGGLGEKSKEVWGNRKLLWGEGCNYAPNETTQKFVDIINAEDTSVVAVLAGHLHFEYICMLNDNVKQYIFNPAFSGEIALFTVTGE